MVLDKGERDRLPTPLPDTLREGEWEGEVEPVPPPPALEKVGGVEKDGAPLGVERSTPDPLGERVVDMEGEVEEEEQRVAPPPHPTTTFRG